MTDAFRMFDDDPAPLRFEEAVAEAVLGLNRAAERFAAFQERVPTDAFSDEEWQIVERAATELEEAAERADESYVAVGYDSHAWYRVLDNLRTVTLRLESATAVMEHVRTRLDAAAG